MSFFGSVKNNLDKVFGNAIVGMFSGYFICKMIEKIVRFYEDNVGYLGKVLNEYFQGVLVNLQIQFIKKKCIDVVFRKEIFMVNFGINIGSEYRGIRPAVVISGGSINKGSMVLIVPCSSYKGNLFKYDVLINNYIECGFNSKTVIKVSHLSSISKKRLVKKIGLLDKTNFDQLIKEINLCIRKKTPPREF